jgi:hypothetical protein
MKYAVAATPQIKKKNVTSRILEGFKKGYSTPTLPDNIIKIQSHPLIRILRFLGGSSFLFILSKTYLNFPLYFLYFAMFFASVFTIYHIIITFIRIKHIMFILKSDKLDIKNSPLDRLATLSARALLCFKGACDSAQPIGLTLGLMLGSDEILKGANREPIFAPFLGSILNTVLPESTHKDSIRLLIDKNITQLENINEEISQNNSLLEKFQSLNLKGDLSKDEFNEFKQILSENRQNLIIENEKIKSKIIELIHNNNK